MHSNQNLPISRRSFFEAGAIGGLALATSSLLFPDYALADTADGLVDECVAAERTYSIHPEVSEREFQLQFDQHFEEEVARVVAEAEAEDEILMSKSSSRPTYTTQYGKKVNKWTPWKTVPGQPKKGTRIQGGGSIFVSNDGGGSVSCSWNFGTPYGTLGISYTIGKKIAVGGENVTIPSTGFYLVQQRKLFECRPYVVYVTKNGKKSVYRRALYREHQCNDLRALRQKDPQ